MTVTIIQYVVNPLLVAGVGYIIKILTDNRKNNKAASRGIMLLLRQRIMQLHKKFVTNGEPMSHDDYDDIVETYNTYKELGGNLMIDKLFHEIDEIRITED